jgi:purine-cytosine permease-like protein
MAAERTRAFVGLGMETLSVDFVPDSARHGKMWFQSAFWFLGNFHPLTLAIGFAGPAMGLSFLSILLATILGTFFGTAFMALHAVQGPKLGLPQMVQSRVQFGHKGVLLPLVAGMATFVAFSVVEVILIKQGLFRLLGWPENVVAIVIVLVSCAIALLGHDHIHKLFRLVLLLSFPVWLAVTIAAVVGTQVRIGGQPTRGFTWVAFLAMFTSCASYNITYAPYVSDYSRYLPSTTKTSSVVTMAFAGAAASPIWLVPLGALLSTRFGVSDPLGVTYAAADELRHGLGGYLVTLSVIILVTQMAMNAYSGMLSLLTAVGSFRSARPNQRDRVVGILLTSTVTLAAALSLDNAVATLNMLLVGLLYLLSPWTAINLVDFFIIRRGRYVLDEFFSVNEKHQNWNAAGIVSYIVALASELPFFVLPGNYSGVIARDLGGLDIAWLVGMIAGALGYIGGRRLHGLDLQYHLALFGKRIWLHFRVVP